MIQVPAIYCTIANAVNTKSMLRIHANTSDFRMSDDIVTFHP